MVADCDVVAAGGELQREDGGRAATMSTRGCICDTWYLVKAPHAPYERQLLRQDQWPEQKDYLCIGQRPQEYFDNTLEPVAGTEAFRHVAFQPLPQELLQSIALGAVRRPVPGMTLPFPTALDRQAYWNYWLHLKGKGKGKGKCKVGQQRMLTGPRL